MHVCMYACMYMYVDACKCMYTNVYVRVCMYMYVNVCTRMYVYAYVCILYGRMYLLMYVRL